MGHRSKNAPRCTRCRMHAASCVCEHIVPLALETRVVLVMHYKELPKTTATGPMALAALDNSELHVHGRRDEPVVSRKSSRVSSGSTMVEVEQPA